jgi:hypothetical protein
LSREWFIGDEEAVKFRVFPHYNEIAGVLIASIEDQLRGIKVRSHLPRRATQLF